MSALQPATSGPDPAIPAIATLERRIGASLIRVWENVLDWEHLPWLHDASFAGVSHLDSGEWGWRVRAALPGPGERHAVYELAIDDARQRYVARTIEGFGQGTEIWTALAIAGEHATDITVTFHVPGLSPGRHDDVGARYVALYQRLWDEDEAMMIAREARLRAAREHDGFPQRHPLGSRRDLLERAPLTVDVAGQPVRLVAIDGALHAHSAVCPHRLGPLDDAVEGEPFEVRCPWHGYRFDVRDGRSCDGRGLHLGATFSVEVDADDRVTLVRR